MRPTLFFAALALVTAPICGMAGAAAAASAQSRICSQEAVKRGLTGQEKTRFHATCMKGPLAPKHPTAPSGPGKEARAITAPSGADRTVRSKACTAEADKRGLTDKARKEFQLSCLATAGPVTEGETHNQPPKPAKEIPGIGINRDQPTH
jgi:hypothetical protein